MPKAERSPFQTIPEIDQKYQQIDSVLAEIPRLWRTTRVQQGLIALLTGLELFSYFKNGGVEHALMSIVYASINAVYSFTKVKSLEEWEEESRSLREELQDWELSIPHEHFLVAESDVEPRMRAGEADRFLRRAIRSADPRRN